jgi:hypothetical protein
LLGKVLSVWDGSAVAGRPPGATATARKPLARRFQRPVGLRSRSPIGLLEALRDLTTRIASSLEELAFLVFFLTFVAFAIGGFLRIYLG